MTTKVSTDMIEIDLTGVFGILVLNQPIAVTIPIQLAANYAWEITHLNVRAASGDITYSVEVAGSAVDSEITNQVISTTPSTDIAGTPVPVAVGEAVEIVFSSPNTPGIIAVEIHGNRT